MKTYLATLAAFTVSATAALAAPINGTGDLTSDVFFGDGNFNGAFSGQNANNIEIGLRGKLRYDANQQPASVYNYDGDRTYTFTPADGNPKTGFSIFNFDWSINADASGAGGAFLDDFTYALSIDYDPSANIGNVLTFDPINLGFADHSLGNNSTDEDTDTKATTAAEYAAGIAGNSVAQNSWNLGFFEPAGFDPQTQGLYTISLFAFDQNGSTLASSSIDIAYGDVSAVPVPAALPLLLAGLGGLAFVGRRRKS